ncbi:MAG: ribonuclease III domain-containing protein [bacterium]|nr:ribonuclease III domain-containing protein [bacterium]
MNERESISDKFSCLTGIKFKNADILVEAVSHRSFKKDVSYQRLEFLGDSLLSFFTSEYFYRKYKLFAEGELSKFRTSIVNRENLSHVFTQLNLSDLVFIDRKSFKDDIPESIKEDIMESLLAAVYLDGGIRAAKKMFKLIIKNSHSVPEEFFAKNQLQELSLGRYKSLPEFKTVESEEKEFVCRIYVNGKYCSEAQGKSKKECEKKAALLAFRKLEKEIQ